MTIECYDKVCPFHSVHTDPDDGPYCHERECHAPACLKLSGVTENRTPTADEWNRYAEVLYVPETR